MARPVPEELKKEARQAFLEYEEVYVTRIAKRPGWKMSAQPVEEVLATGDEGKIRQYIEQLRRDRRDILDSNVS